VHALPSLPPTVCLADAMRVLTANASRWVHETWPARRRFAWQAGYAAFGVSESQRDRVEQYIRAQEVHHRRLSFQEEVVALLRRHGIEFDERYMWA